MTSKLYLATMEAGPFSFQSVASTEFGAKTAITRGWTEHAKQTGADIHPTNRNLHVVSTNELDDYFGINVVALEMNNCARDYEPLNVH